MSDGTHIVLHFNLHFSKSYNRNNTHDLVCSYFAVYNQIFEKTEENQNF